jgi:DNA invertase Pin-like site-specific DNA recombinase
MVFGMFAALGEYERELMRERILAGQKRARAAGIKIGRASKLNDAVKTCVRLLRDGYQEDCEDNRCGELCAKVGDGVNR